ncbi:MAG: SGNH/GDSL hydrolase family protein [Candidatus Krumholzibacteriia bacterium]
MKESTGLRSTRMFFVASFLIATVLIASLSLAQPLKSNIAAGYLWGIFLVLGTRAIGSCTGKRRRYLRFFLVAAAINLVITPPEVFLRLRGFSYEPNIQFGYPRPYQISSAERDEKLFWTLPKSRPGINSYGFDGPEPARPKPAGTYPIVFLGNTCTYSGLPAITELLLRETHPEVECLNFALPGYSSYQGTLIAKSILAELEPDLLVVSFGWNDRWLAFGEIDAEKRIIADRGAGRSAAGELYSRWRLLQLSRKALAPVLGESKPLEVSRVPADQFKKNLEEIGAEAERLGAPVIFATEPSSHPSLGVPDDVVSSTYAKSKGDALALFRQYNDIIRRVASERRSWRLLDLDALMSSRSEVRRLFNEDGVRYSKAGTAVVADLETRYILEHFLAPHGT